MEPPPAFNVVWIFLKSDGSAKANPSPEEVKNAICDFLDKPNAVEKIADLENYVLMVKLKFEKDVEKLIANGNRIDVNKVPFALVGNDIFVRRNVNTWLLPNKIFVVLQKRCQMIGRQVTDVFGENDVHISKECEGGPWKIEGNPIRVSLCVNEFREIFLKNAKFPIENGDFDIFNRILGDKVPLSYFGTPTAKPKAAVSAIPKSADRRRQSNSGKTEAEKICSICLSQESEDLRFRKLPKCGHEFHRKCLEQWLCTKPICPYCKQPIGCQPAGGTFIKQYKYGRDIDGFDGAYGYIEITYSIPDGIQGPEHPNPGRPYKGTTRSAFLPNNDQGRKIAQLLKIAFENGLILNVGKSETTGESNVIIWHSLIPHKTSLDAGGPYGYPDASYLNMVEKCLNENGIKDDLLPSREY